MTILRDCRVVLDADLAELYGVETRALNQAVKRNAERFPADFMFVLTKEEVRRISQSVTSSRRGAELKFSKRVAARAGGDGGPSGRPREAQRGRDGRRMAFSVGDNL